MSDLSCEINRTINAPIDDVFDAWTDPEQLRQWHCPDGMTVPSADVDAKVGGDYSIVMRAPDGSDHVATGTFKEVTRPTKLVMSWQWKDGDGEVTEVTITLKRVDADTTDLTLVHRYFITAESMQNHKQGWENVLEKLSLLVEKK